MRFFIILGLLSTLACAQNQPQDQSAVKPTPVVSDTASSQLVIPAGTKVALVLKHAISTRGTHDGDAVYAESTFPVVINDRVVIPAGTYVQGRITHIQRGGHVSGKAEVLVHFTTLIYPSGYTVMLPGSLENAPGVDKTKVKDDEGTIQADSQTAQKVGQVAGVGATGAIIGAAASGVKGMAIGGVTGAAVGTAIALLTRGNDVKMDVGTSVEMVIQREVPIDAKRVPNTTSTAAVAP